MPARSSLPRHGCRSCVLLSLFIGIWNLSPSSAGCQLAARSLVASERIFRERLQRVFRKKTSAELHLIYIFASSHLHISHLRILSLFFSSSLKAGVGPPEHRESQPSAETVRVEGAKCRWDCATLWLCAVIVHVEGAKCRWDCVFCMLGGKKADGFFRICELVCEILAEKIDKPL